MAPDMVCRRFVEWIFVNVRKCDVLRLKTTAIVQAICYSSLCERKSTIFELYFVNFEV